MKILAIDSSGLVASTALLVDQILVGEYTINNKKTHSQTLLPMIDQMMAIADVDISEVDAIAIASGPGSFTGLRIGAATAKGLAGALKVPIVPVPTLEGLAMNLAETEGLICPLMDARRNQAYYGIYSFCDGKIVCEEKPDAAPIEDIIAKINEKKESVTFLGDGVPVFFEIIKKMAEVPIFFAKPHQNYQKAGAIAVLGNQYLQEGKQLEAFRFAPDYLRLSQAERERMENISCRKMEKKGL